MEITETERDAWFGVLFPSYGVSRSARVWLHPGDFLRVHRALRGWFHPNSRENTLRHGFYGTFESRGFEDERDVWVSSLVLPRTVQYLEQGCQPGYLTKGDRLPPV